MAIFLTRLTIFFTFFALLLTTGCKSESLLGPPIKVSLKVDTGTGTPNKDLSITVIEKQTVIDAMNVAKSQGLDYKVAGEGAGAMVTEINGISSDKPENAGKNWIFYINQKKANRSAGVYPLAQGDAILWKFEAFDPNQSND